MSRVIKFRVWSKTYGYLFRAGDGIGYQNYDIDMRGRITREILGPDLCSADRTTTEDQSNYVIQQFTGFVDKSGREIYEGDIVSFTVKGITHGPDPEDYEKAEVWFDEEAGQWMFGKWVQPESTFNGYTSKAFTYGYSMMDRIDPASLLVTGNIFEGAPHDNQISSS